MRVVLRSPDARARGGAPETAVACLVAAAALAAACAPALDGGDEDPAAGEGAAPPPAPAGGPGPAAPRGPGAPPPAGADARAAGGAAADAGAPGGAADGSANLPPAVRADGSGAPPAPPPPAGGDPGPTSPILPILWIEVDGKAIPRGVKIPGRLKVIYDHDGTHRNVPELAATKVALATPMGIEVRGNFTASLPKKPYGIELRDGTGADRALPFLGMPAESDFVLLAPYTDKTYVRSPLAHAVARELGRWNPRFRFVEIFIDTRYQGLYIAIEKIKRDKNRVDIPKAAPDPAAGDATGGYIFRHEGGGKGGARDFTSRKGIKYSYHEPRFDEITAAQKAYLQQLVDRFETMMDGPDFALPDRGYRAAIDVASWVDFALVRELVNDWDGYVRSVYFVKEPDARGGKLLATPLWDFDLAFGNISLGNNYRTDVWAYQKPFRPPPDNVPSYWTRLWGDPAFQAALKCRWLELRKGPLAKAWLDARIDGWVAQLKDAERRDHARWPVIGMKIFPNYYSGATYADEVAWMRDWIGKRLAWLDANLPGVCAR
jgi:hypothetical protein